MSYELKLTIIEMDLQSDEIEVSTLLGAREFIQEIETALKGVKK